MAVILHRSWVVPVLHLGVRYGVACKRGAATPRVFCSSLGLPAHAGRGAAVILRTNRSESLFDTIVKLRAEAEVFQLHLADPLRRPPQSQLEVAFVGGKLTNQNPIDRIALGRVAQ